jgi:glutathione S-transferase
MTLTPPILYIAPGSSSRVALVALEAAQISFEARLVSLMTGAQRQPDFLALNPKGKVPLLVTAQGRLSENIAIIIWADAQFPQAGLLPPVADTWARVQAMAWLSWSASTVHPMIYRLRMTPRIHADAATHPGIRSAALEELALQLAVAEDALADGRAWLGGERWCMADTYLCWAFGRGVDCGLQAQDFPRLSALAERHAQLPAFQRAVARENPDQPA